MNTMYINVSTKSLIFKGSLSKNYSDSPFGKIPDVGKIGLHYMQQLHSMAKRNHRNDLANVGWVG